MPVKIMIDAGHGGYDSGATYGNRREKDDALRLALAVGELLQQKGYDVEYTRTTDVYDSPVEKARIANESGADFFVSIHRNSSPTPNQYHGVQTLVFNDTGIKAEMARNINKRLEDVGFRNINVDERPNLAVLRRTRMPALLVEAGFINSDIDNNLFDTRFDDIAAAIAQGIDETIRSAGITDPPAFADDNPAGDRDMPDDGTRGRSDTDNMRSGEMDDGSSMPSEDEGYQILVGIYRGFGPASYQMNRLINEGYFAEIFEDEGLFQVRVGEYSSIEEALIAQRELRDRGYDTLIVRANPVKTNQ